MITVLIEILIPVVWLVFKLDWSIATPILFMLEVYTDVGSNKPI